MTGAKRRCKVPGLQPSSAGSGNVILASGACAAGAQARGAQPGPAPTQRLPRAAGGALFTNVGKRLLEIKAAGSAFLALARFCLRVPLPSIGSLPSFNLKQQQSFQVKSERPQRCRLWGTMERTSLFLLGSRLRRLKPSPSS